MQKHGIALVPESRKTEGLLLNNTIKFNTTLAVLDRFIKNLVVNTRKEDEITEDGIEKLHIKTPSSLVNCSTLSGGNQQKLVLSREVDKDPDLILACQPVRGLDIGAIKFIHNVLLELRNQGKAVLLISAELSDLFQLSDRIGVLYKGEMMSLQETEKYTTESISLLMAGKKGV